jgi:hypothetical protein
MLRKNVMDLMHLPDTVPNLGHVKLCFEIDIFQIEKLAILFWNELQF